MEVMAVDHHVMMSRQGRDSMRAMVTKRILASCEDTRYNTAVIVQGLSCGGSLEYSVFPPFIKRGKRFLDANFVKVVLPSPHTYHTYLDHRWKNQAFTN